MHETKQNEDVLQDVEKCMKEEHKEPENSNDDLYSRMKPYIDDYEKFKDRCKIAIKNEVTQLEVFLWFIYINLCCEITLVKI